MKKHLVMLLTLVAIVACKVTEEGGNGGNVTLPPAGPVELPAFDATKSTIITNTFTSTMLKGLTEGSTSADNGEKERRYIVYIPNKDTYKTVKYPVIYFLHGLGSGKLEEQMVKMVGTDGAGMKAYLDKAITDGVIPPSIVIFPNGHNVAYTDAGDLDGENMKSHFIKELFPYMDKTYNLQTDRNLRAIGGASMGGHGTLVLAFSMPESFSVAFAQGPAVTALDKAPAALVGNINSRDCMNKVYKENGTYSQKKWDQHSYHHPFADYLTQNHKIKWTIGVGSTDTLIPPVDVKDAYDNLKAEGVDVTYTLINGSGHDGTTWKKLTAIDFASVGTEFKKYVVIKK